MLQLSLSIIFYPLIIALTAYIMPGIRIENIFLLIPAVLLGALMNFILTPLLTGMRIRVSLPTLGLACFIINFLLLNITMGLLDEFGRKSWESALFGAILLSLFQVLMDSTDSSRKMLIS